MLSLIPCWCYIVLAKTIPHIFHQLHCQHWLFFKLSASSTFPQGYMPEVDGVLEEVSPGFGLHCHGQDGGLEVLG